MIWEEAIEEAKGNLGICGYTNDWDSVVNEAKKILSKEKSKIETEKHKIYLESYEWKKKREKILKRDNYICQDCKKIIEEVLNKEKTPIFFDEKFIINILINLQKIFGGKNYFIEAKEVHHLDYQYKQTPKEEEYCVSLCSLCHKIRHSSWNEKDKIYWNKRRLDHLIKSFFIRLSKLSVYQKKISEIHQSELKKITFKPKEIFNKRINKNGK